MGYPNDENEQDGQRVVVAMEIAGAESIPECNTRPTEIDQSKDKQ